MYLYYDIGLLHHGELAPRAQRHGAGPRDPGGLGGVTDRKLRVHGTGSI